MADKKRIVWIDQLRGLAFYFVVLGHMIIPEGLEIWIYSFHMPLFFMISGFNLNVKKMAETNFKDYISHLASRMLIPYLWLQLIGLGIKYTTVYLDRGGEIGISGYFKGIFLGNSFIQSAASNAMYFVLLLFLAQVVIFGLAKLTKGNKWIMFAIIIALTPISIFTEGKNLIWHCNVIPTAMLFLFIGRFFMDGYIAVNKKLMRLKRPYYIGLCVVLLIAGGVLAFINGRASIHGNFFGEVYVTFVISAVLTSMAFSLLVMLLPSVELFKFIGMNTIFLLGIHEPFFVAVRAVFPEQWEKGWFVAIASVVCYFLPVPVAWLFSKFAPYVCGKPIKKETIVIKIAKFVAVALVFATPYIRFTGLFLDGAMRASSFGKTVSAVVFLLLVVGIERLFTLVLPVFFLQNKKEQAATKENKPVVYEDEGIMIIIPVEEI